MFVFAATVFAGAFLLFQIELLIARFLLPWYGGAPAVWTASVLFFQLVLLAGYAWVHLGGRRLSRRGLVATQVLLLLAAVLTLGIQWLCWDAPLLPSHVWKPQQNQPPLLPLLAALTAAAGLPCLVLSTASPLLQKWFLAVWPERSPYRLYALSNAGSLLGLLSYPFLVEPNLRLRSHAIVLATLFAVFAAGFAACAMRVRRCAPTIPPGEGGGVSISRLHIILWFALSACGSALLLATTNLICQDIAVVPMLWVLPLTLYLLSFILCFERERPRPRPVWMFAFAGGTALACWAMIKGLDLSMFAQIGALATVLFTGCMVCHGELVRLKPPGERLTAFYLAISTGGAAGGLFVSVLAPLLFTGYWEFHVTLWLAWTLVFATMILDPESAVRRGARWLPVVLLTAGVGFLAFFFSPQAQHALRPSFGRFALATWIAMAALTALILAAVLHKTRLRDRLKPDHPRWVCAGLLAFWALLSLTLLVQRFDFYDDTRHVERNFFGVLRVTEEFPGDATNRCFALRHGRINHGRQFAAEGQRHLPTMYYTENSGVGLALRSPPGRKSARRIAVVGLGVGTLACYSQPGDEVVFYEINPAVIELSQRAEWFTYVRDAQGAVRIVPGDARLRLEQELEDPALPLFDVIVVDAFSGDSIPVHLLNREAFALYLQRLAPDGVLCLHLSNRYLRLAPVVAALAAEAGLTARRVTEEASGARVSASEWALLFRTDATINAAVAEAGEALTPSGSRRFLWTDDFSNLLDVLR